jgi:hypothetical protein
MEILASASEWTHIDSENLAKFLETETGKRLIPRLTENIPQLLDGGDTNRVLIRSGEVRAFSAMLETFLLLAHPPALPKPSASEYPSPEDDSAWNDGQKINVGVAK